MIMKQSKSDRILSAAFYFVLAIAALSCVLPIINVFAIAFSEAAAVDSGLVSFWPVGFTLKSFNLLIQKTMAVKAMWNSAVVTVMGTIISMVLTISAAYPLSKPWFTGNAVFTKAVIFTMLFSGGMIPTYIVIQRLGLVDTYWAIWLSTSVSTYNMLILRTFFKNIPRELEEAGFMDGCGEVRMMFSIYLPLSKPVLATLILFYGVGYWNVFMSALLYINSPAKQVLSVLVQQMIRSMDVLNNEIINANPQDLLFITTAGLRSAGVVVITLPLLLVYPLLQKYFVKGVMLGSVKA
jgi:putative aldouronate transport system permease protein